MDWIRRFVAKKLKWSDMKDYRETVSDAHHSYPCTGSMERDPILGDTILHEGGYIIRRVWKMGFLFSSNINFNF